MILNVSSNLFNHKNHGSMKKYILYLIMVVFAFSLVSCTASYVVSDRPAEVVYTRPVAPGPNYIWIGGDWVWAGGRYQWHEGYWDNRHNGRRWQDGHWSHVQGGNRWEKGHWHK